MTVLWFKTGWDVSDKVYRKAGQGANGGITGGIDLHLVEWFGSRMAWKM
jgi:hypothetical protein